MYTAIIADDEPWIIYGLKSLVDWHEYGFDIIDTAMDGLSALDKVSALKPDLLLSDIRMPGLNGLELVRRMKDASPETEVVFVSGYTEFEYAREAIRLGAFDYLVKQVEDDALAAMLKRVAEKLNLRRANDWDLYFHLFDADAQLSAADCANILALDAKSDACRFATMIFDKPINRPLISRAVSDDLSMLIFRTGACKLGALIFGHTQPDVESALHSLFPGFIALGLSDAATTDANFYALYQCADVAAATARDHSPIRSMTYRQAKRALEINAHSPAAEAPICVSDGAAQSQITRILDELDNNFTQDLRVNDLARKFFISPNYLCILIKRATGETYSDYIINHRINLAKQLLRDTELPIQEIIDRIGYRDYAHFNKLFKKREGITPSKYRRDATMAP